MRKHPLIPILFLAGLLALGCSDSGGDDDGGTGDDGQTQQDGDPGNNGDNHVPGDGDQITVTDGDCEIVVCPNPVQPGCGNDEICNDGLDNNCNGMVDELCICNPGDVQPCFAGPPGLRNVGACQDGHQVCVLDVDYGYWGECKGGMLPTDQDLCDSVDNNCNGCVDENLCCTGELDCPDAIDDRIPSEVAPFSEVVLYGPDFYDGPVLAWNWTVEGTPCDQLFWETVGKTTFDIEGDQTDTLTLFFRLSGDYKVTMTVTTPIGLDFSCPAIIHVKGPGLRVEMCWDNTGRVDMDLHLHRPNSTADWSDEEDDCYWENCTGEEYYVSWGYDDTDLSRCINGPLGVNWEQIGVCHNPRLDIDNRAVQGWPENVNIDNPHNGDKFRVMVEYYVGDHRPTHPMVNIYCGGHLKGTYGADPDLVEGMYDSGMEPMWRVVDVTTLVQGIDYEHTDCNLEALRDPLDPSLYWVTYNDYSY